MIKSYDPKYNSLSNNNNVLNQNNELNAKNT